MPSDKPTLIAISVKSIQQEPYISPHGGLFKSAVIEGASQNPEVSFEMKTGLLHPEQVHCCELLRQHGFTVVEVPDNWRWGYNGLGGWQEVVIKAAMERVVNLYGDSGEVEMTETYDSNFAEQVLAEINKHFPHAVQTSQLKHAFEKEPNDSALLTALAGLQRDGFIEGKTMFSSITAQRSLMAMANIEITAAGRKHLSGASAQSPAATIIIQGDQFNNYGLAGAMGHHSSGTVNYENEWAALKDQIDLSTIANELRSTIQQLHQTASSSEDHQRLQMLFQAKKQAEKKDGGKVLELLSKMGQSALPIFAKYGAEGIVRLIGHHLNLGM
jgi:hypothetical protein